MGFFSGKANKNVLSRTGLHIQGNPELSNLLRTQKVIGLKIGSRNWECLTETWKSTCFELSEVLRNCDSTVYHFPFHFP